MQKNRMLWLCMFLFLLTAGLAAQPKPIASQAATDKTAVKEPFDLTEIEKLLRANLTLGRMISLVEQYGVNFPLTDSTEKELRNLGADDKLLLAIAKNRVQAGASFPAQPPTLQPAPSAGRSGLTWTDPTTGLMWTKQSNRTNVTWSQAQSYCTNLSLSGYSTWRLPTIEELEGIYDSGQTVDRCHVKGGIQFHELCWSWSSSPGIDSGEAWGFGFISGQQSSIPQDGSRYDTRVLCVRRAGK